MIIIQVVQNSSWAMLIFFYPTYVSHSIDVGVGNIRQCCSTSQVSEKQRDLASILDSMIRNSGKSNPTEVCSQ